MKTTRLRTAVASIPFDPPVGIGTAEFRCNGAVLVFLESDQGPVGEGLVCSLNAVRIAEIEALVRAFAPLAVGLDPRLGGVFTAKAGALARAHKDRDLAIIALSGVEGALWDLRAKLLGVNVSQMLGACRASLPAYHSGELWITLGVDELQRAAEAHLRNGFRAMKMRLKGEAKEDVARVRAVREAIGPGIGLMADLNQKMRSAPEAIALGRQLEEFRLDWLEEPIGAQDHAGEAEIAAALETPLASGESVFTSAPILDMLRRRSADVLMPDLQRMGGPAEFLKAASLADAHGVPVSGHLYPEMSLALLASVPNACTLEYMPWASALYAERIELDAQGHAVVPERPGWGYRFDPAAIRRYAMEGRK